MTSFDSFGVGLIVIASASTAALLVACYTLLKVRRVHLLLFDVAERIDRLADVHLVRTSRQLEALAGLYVELGLEHSLGPTRGWFASPDFLALAAGVARGVKRPQTVLECGSGTSTIVLAQCMKLNGRGHVYSLEHDSGFAERTRREIARHGLEAWATVYDAPLVPHHLNGTSVLWYQLDAVKIPEVDLMIIDGPPAPIGPLARYPALPLLRDRLRPGSVLLLDDAAREDEQAVLKKWRGEFPDITFEEVPLEKGAAVLRVRAATQTIEAEGSRCA